MSHSSQTRRVGDVRTLSWPTTESLHLDDFDVSYADLRVELRTAHDDRGRDRGRLFGARRYAPNPHMRLIRRFPVDLGRQQTSAVQLTD